MLIVTVANQVTGLIDSNMYISKFVDYILKG